jgi:hypothetical protein
MDELKFESLEEIDEETQKLIVKYVVAHSYIIRLLKQQINKNLNEQQSQLLLSKIQRRLKELDNEAFKYIKNVFPNYYYLSLNILDNIVVNLDNVKILKGAEHAIHKQALKRAQEDLFNDLAKRTKFMSESAKKIIRENSKSLLQAMIEQGTSQKQIKQELKDLLEKQGVSSFVDASKRNWKIDRYVDMAVRTKSRILHNEGTINRLKEYQENSLTYNENFDLIQISNHSAEDWCSLYENKVYSVSGNHPIYPSVETLPNYPYKIFHPNCKHVWLPYVIGLRGSGQKIDSKYQNLSIKELNKIEYQQRTNKK